MFNLSQSVWEQIADTQSELAIYKVIVEDGISVFTGHRDATYKSFVTTANLDAFSSKYGARVQEVALLDDATVLLAGTTPTIVPPSVDNVPITALSYSAIDDSGRFLGDSFVASGLATTIHDFKIENDLRLEGADWYTTGHEWGDYGSFAVVDKDDVLGLFQYYGLEPGEVLELKRYVQNVPLPSSTACPFYERLMTVMNPAFVCSGLYLRCIVDNNHEGDINVGAIYHTYLED